MNRLKLAYFGTPDFAAAFLEAILNANAPTVELVITQPDSKVGKKQLLTPSPVKSIAYDYGCTIYDGNIKDESLINLMKEKKIDICLLFAYGEIIPKSLLDIPKYGFWNIHPSLLPLYRGSGPIAYPLMLGDTETGVTLMLMDEKLDHGPIISQQKVSIDPQAVRPQMEKILTDTAYDLFLNASKELGMKEKIQTIEQKHEEATYTRMFKKSDGFVPYEVLKEAIQGKENDRNYLPDILKHYYEKNNITAQEKNISLIIFNLYRAMFGWPGIWTNVTVNGQMKRLKINKINYREGKIMIEKLQLEGKNEVDFITFQRAYNLF